MKILGVDPGLLHTGWAVLDNGRITARGVILFPEEGKHPTEEYVRYIVPEMIKVITAHRPAYGAVEQVAWHGRKQRVTMPLSHVAGAIIGVLYSHGVHVCMLTPNMKKGITLKQPASWSDHEYDAALLAKKLAKYLDAERAEDASALKVLEAVGRRIITVEAPAPGSASKKGCSGKRR